MLQKQCQSCKIYIPQARTCRIMVPAMQGRIGPEDYCSKHKEHLLTCEICGADLLAPIIEVVDGAVHVYCDNCVNFPRP